MRTLLISLALTLAALTLDARTIVITIDGDSPMTNEKAVKAFRDYALSTRIQYPVLVDTYSEPAKWKKRETVNAPVYEYAWTIDNDYKCHTVFKQLTALGFDCEYDEPYTKPEKNTVEVFSIAQADSLGIR